MSEGRLSRSATAAMLLGLIGSAGCAPRATLAVAPEVLSTDWRAQPAAQDGQKPLSAGLASAFGSPALEALVARALSANADIGAAKARVEQARAQLRVARAAMLPVVTASADLGARQRDGSLPALAEVGAASAALDLSWDADLFGRNRAARDASQSRFAAAAFDRDGIALAVEAEVVRAAVQWAALAERIALLDQNIKDARETERIIGVRLREGVATKVDTGLQAIEVRQLETERLRLVESRTQTRNALALLLGEEAPLFDLPAIDFAALDVPEFAAVQPGALLVRRPDIRASEARIEAASGDVRSARAAFLPSLRLSGSGLAQAASLGGPLGLALSATSSLLAPIFNRGRARAEVGVQKAAHAEAVETYRRTLLVALQEAEDALAAADQSRARQSLLDQAVAEARTTARLSRLQYIEGEADVRWMLDAQRLVVQIEDARTLSRQERMNAAIDVYRAMGGPGAPASGSGAQASGTR